jgi:hypothetical protein
MRVLNANDLLGVLLERGMGGPTRRRVDQGLGAAGGGAGGGLGELLGAILGQGAPGATPSPRGRGRAAPPSQGGLDAILGEMLGQRGGPAASRGLPDPGGLGSVLGRDSPTGLGPGAARRPAAPRRAPAPPPEPAPRAGGGGIGLGGLAVLSAIGILAARALSGTGGGAATTAPPPPPLPPQPLPPASARTAPTEPALPPGSSRRVGRAATPPPLPAEVAAPAPDEVAKAQLVIAAMINAAKADGRIDQDEVQRIMGRLGTTGADPEVQAFLRAEAALPFDLERIAAPVRDPTTAVQVYLASLLAIEVDTAAEARYLQALARRLGLPDDYVAALHRQVGLAPLAS